jgi:hypothetical protein
MLMFSSDAEFLPIGEEEEFEIVEEEDTEEKAHPLDSDVVKADLMKKRARTAVLVHDAESNIIELWCLLGITSTGTASHAEKD